MAKHPNQADTSATANFESELRQVDEQIDANRLGTQTTTTTEASPKETVWWTTQSAMTMSSVVLLFGVAILALAVVLVRKGTPAEDVLKVFGTIVIIVMTVFLVIAGYNDQQIAPAMGLLGTIAGYLLGKEGVKAKAP